MNKLDIFADTQAAEDMADAVVIPTTEAVQVEAAGAAMAVIVRATPVQAAVVTVQMASRAHLLAVAAVAPAMV